MEEVFQKKIEEVEDLLKDSPAALAQFKAQRQGGHQWLNYQFMGRNMMSKVFQFALASRLLYPHFSSGSTQNQLCHCRNLRRNPNREAVCLGDPKQEMHAFSCFAMKRETSARHDILYKELQKSLSKFLPQLSFQREWQFWNPVRRKRLVVDLKLEAEDESFCYLIDFSFVNIASASTLSRAPEALVNDREKAKINKYTKFFSEDQMKFFVPFVMDSAGNVGKLALTFLKELTLKQVNIEVDLKNEVLASLQACYWNWFFKFHMTFNDSFLNPSVEQRNNHDSSSFYE